MAEEQAAQMEAAGAENGEDGKKPIALMKSRIVHLTPNGDGWTAKVSSNGSH